jgi:drug/metabolite transporter (DMT)-like permease
LSQASKRPSLKGALLGLAAALTFGIGVPMAKELLNTIQPTLLAALLYFGSAAGLFVGWSIHHIKNRKNDEPPIHLRGWDWACLAGAILAGGVCGQILELFGLSKIPASEASLLLNLEAVFTALTAWVLFKEPAGKRVVLGMSLLTLGACMLSVNGSWQFTFSLGSAAVALSCVAWAIDNNVTRRISHTNPVFIVMMKGLFAGSIDLAISLAMRAPWPPLLLVGVALCIGVVSYGISLSLYVLAMRYIGAARTAAYFCFAPFVGALVAMVFLHEPITVQFGCAALLMAAGIWLHMTETHDHVHVHDAVTHEHVHSHDDHHCHDHPQGSDEPHSHVHTHEKQTHSHEHQPDMDHFHEH